MTTIRMSYRASDGFVKRARYQTLKGARAFAVKWVGRTPEIASNYAVSADGVGRITWEGTTAGELFPRTAGPNQEPAPDPCCGEPVLCEDCGANYYCDGTCNCWGDASRKQG